MKQYFLTLICTLSFVISLQSQEKIFHLDVGWSIAKQEQIPTKVSISGKPKQIEALPCKIYLFNGLDDGIRIEDWTAKSFFSKDQSFTVEFYFKPEKNTNAKAWSYIASLGPLVFAAKSQSGSPWLFINAPKRILTTGLGNKNFDDGCWHHIAFVRDTRLRRITYYCDGKVIKDVPETSSLTAAFAKNSSITIGMGPRGWNGHFKGAIKQFVIWSTVIRKYNLNSTATEKSTTTASVDQNLQKNWLILQEKSLNLFPVPKHLNLREAFDFIPAHWSVERRSQNDSAGYAAFLSRLKRIGLNAPEGGENRIISGLYSQLKDELKKINAPDNTERQGYIIIFSKDGVKRRIYLAGHDDNGLRYAWLTLSQLLKDNKRMYAATISDWPDFVIRRRSSNLRQISYDEIDEAFLCRVNVLSFGGSMEQHRAYPIEKWNKLRDYARERGIEFMMGYYTNVLDIHDWQKQIPAGYGPHYYPYRTQEGLFGYYGHAFSWARDDLAQARGQAIGLFLKERGFTYVGFHSVDYGGEENPGNWANRTSMDHAKWGNDRPAAETHLMTLFADEIHKINPKIQIQFTEYPYYPTADKKTLAYYAALSQKLKGKVFFQMREGERHLLETTMKQFSFSRVHICHYPYEYTFYPSFANSARFVPTFYFGPESMASITHWYTIDPKCCASDWCYFEFLWNAFSPGGEYLPPDHYQYHRVFGSSVVIENELLPRICSVIYGEKAGPLVAKAYSCKFSVRIPELPEQILPVEIDREQFMENMVKNAEDALLFLTQAEKVAYKEALSRIKPHKVFLNRCRLLAQARLHALRSRNFLEMEKIEMAVTEAEKGKRILEDKTVKGSRGYKEILSDLDIAEAINLRKKQEEYLQKISPRPLSVAFYKYAGNGDGGGKIGLLPASLNGKAGIRTSIITNLTWRNLKDVDVLIFNASMQLGDCEENAVENVKQFVHNGGGVIFAHNAVGRYASAFKPTFFPSICKGFADRVVNRQKLNVVHDKIFEHFLKKGDTYIHRYNDHCQLTPGPKGKVVLTNYKRQPVMIIGKIGKGRCVYTGEIFGTKASLEAKPDEMSWKMLLNLIRWCGNEHPALSGGGSESQINDEILKSYGADR